MFHPLTHYPFARRLLFTPARRRLRITGEENIPHRGPFIIVANHQSYLDPPMVGMVFIPRVRKKIGTITKTTVARAFGRFGAYLGMIGINPAEPAESVARAKAWLNAGSPVLLFPEAKRNYDPNTLQKGKTGAARLAFSTGLPVVPVGIVVPSGKTTKESLHQFFLTRTPLAVHIGTPLHFEKTDEGEVSKELLEKATQTMMLGIANLCGKNYPY